jgi:hypothetical protein
MPSQRAVRYDTSDLGHLGPGNWTLRAPHPSIVTITPKQAIRGSSQAKVVISKS